MMIMNKYFLGIISSSFFIFACFLVPRTASEEPINAFTSCLTQHHTNNFTTYPNNQDDPSAYFTYFNFSIQNLRFGSSSPFPKPVAIVMPQSRDELASCVKCCRRVSMEIRVRSGGHSYEGTSSVPSHGVSQFVIIDMVNLDGVRVELESEEAWVEGGATLGQTYYAIAESSQVHGFSAGTCPTVGVGGHISGGGFGLLSRKYGLAADNILDAILVDGEGRILDREAMGEEVFWAIRGGGGGNWGIVYAWKIQLLRVPKYVTCCTILRSRAKRQIVKLVHKWQLVAPALPDEFYLSVVVRAGLPEADAVGVSANFNGFYLGPRAEAISMLNEAFPELELREEECEEMSWINSILYFSGIENASSISQLTDRRLQDKMYFKAKSDYVKSPVSYPGIKSAIEILEGEPKGYLILDPYGGVMERISSDFIPFPHREGNLYAIQYRVEWQEEDDAKSEEYMGWIRGIYKSLTSYVSRAPRAAYVNYIDLDLGVMDDYLEVEDGDDDEVEKARAWGEMYYLRNYDRLVGVKTLIDPMNVFRTQQGIPPVT